MQIEIDTEDLKNTLEQLYDRKAKANRVCER